MTVPGTEPSGSSPSDGRTTAVTRPSASRVEHGGAADGVGDLGRLAECVELDLGRVAAAVGQPGQAVLGQAEGRRVAFRAEPQVQIGEAQGLGDLERHRASVRKAGLGELPREAVVIGGVEAAFVGEALDAPGGVGAVEAGIALGVGHPGQPAVGVDLEAGAPPRRVADRRQQAVVVGEAGRLAARVGHRGYAPDAVVGVERRVAVAVGLGDLLALVVEGDLGAVLEAPGEGAVGVARQGRKIAVGPREVAGEPGAGDGRQDRRVVEAAGVRAALELAADHDLGEVGEPRLELALGRAPWRCPRASSRRPRRAARHSGSSRRPGCSWCGRRASCRRGSRPDGIKRIPRS